MASSRSYSIVINLTLPPLTQEGVRMEDTCKFTIWSLFPQLFYPLISYQIPIHKSYTAFLNSPPLPEMMPSPSQSSRSPLQIAKQLNKKCTSEEKIVYAGLYMQYSWSIKEIWAPPLVLWLKMLYFLKVQLLTAFAHQVYQN